MYQILINYDSGDSFNSYTDLERTVEISHNKVLETGLETAKKNIQRLKEHHEWVCSYHRYWKKQVKIPEHVKKNNKEPTKTDRFGDEVIDHDCEYYTHLIDSDGQEVKICCFWNGYFETLNEVKIVSTEDDGWSFKA